MTRKLRISVTAYTLEARPKPLPEAHPSSAQRAGDSVSPGLSSLPAPHGLHQPHLEPLEELRLLHHRETRKSPRPAIARPAWARNFEVVRSHGTFFAAPHRGDILEQ
jgi:hypothetical protein